MGSRQSSPSTGTDQTPTINETTHQQSNDVHSTTTNTTTTTNTKKKKKRPPPPKNLQGFALVEYKCRRTKQIYDRCYAQKHSAFVSGTELQDAKGEEIVCDDLFDAYRECVLFGMRRLREERGLPPPGKESALGDFEEEIAED
mmetsp:Transcript_19999/g.23899  ORF Transcript_19999/g.23899 Transcript_19999/m.23899 type:complete len:143 (+) Transcript_19999:160-588(+)|eukprot:CAMPEP_0198250584 /NCGR_PEP_ID=MMETSP1447-20131203/1712_1 /TAXON_ID=420782 /ORGANISM="Chaetoceros dichaeta, Strain CCMP1751" /LENGTH=142 /DNA_ID=CAMNT_0043935431 /DNA_START=124 /DNA_END=552 /DNA_ORIENTATION=+